jgi:hypothetical protein
MIDLEDPQPVQQIMTAVGEGIQPGAQDHIPAHSAGGRPLCAVDRIQHRTADSVQVRRLGRAKNMEGLMTECDVGQVASSRSGGLDSRARAVPPLSLRSCGYGGEQRPAVTATAWQPLSPDAAEQALSWPVSAFRARIGRKVWKR